MSALTEAALLREVARVQHDKTLQAVRDVINEMPVTTSDLRDSWKSKDISAKEFRTSLVAALIKMREAT